VAMRERRAREACCSARERLAAHVDDDGRCRPEWMRGGLERGRRVLQPAYAISVRISIAGESVPAPGRDQSPGVRSARGSTRTGQAAERASARCDAAEQHAAGRPVAARAEHE
jgi:hypothetical protein